MAYKSLKVLKPSRKKVSEGDVFVVQPHNMDQYVFGRVISTTAQLLAFDELILLYVYKSFSESKDDVPELSKNNLLIPPVMTNKQGWLKGYFETIINKPIDNADKLQHCFYDQLTNSYFDDMNNQLNKKIEPCGLYGLVAYEGVGDDVCDALGVPVLDDE